MRNLLAKCLVLSLFIVSCSNMKSGQYVFVETPSQAKKMARRYGVTEQELKNANPSKSFAKQWIFIPSKVGFAHMLFNNTYVVEDYSSLGTGRFLWPVPHFYKVSSQFGQRGSRHHDGIDIPAPKGTPIIAVDSGVVIYSDNGIRGYGNMIVVSHGDEIFTVYAHNNSNKVDKGDKVKKGEVIALIGNTGRSTGPHLHFEIRVKNKVRNPAQYLSKKN